MHRVLMPVDGSETALRAATRYAAMASQLQKTEVLLLNVQSPIPMNDRILSGRPSEVKHLEAPLRDAAGKLFVTTCKVLDDAGIAHAEYVEFGDPPAVIAEFAQKYHCEQIIMGTRGMGAIAQIVLGSVATKVLHLAAMPVMLVR